MMTNTNTAPRETPLEMLRRLLPTVGFTLSTDTDTIYRTMWRRGMTNGELKAVIAAWIARAERQMQAAAGTSHKRQRYVRMGHHA